jgi:glycosyltransferase involved in cell wall biosynthesis
VRIAIVGTELCAVDAGGGGLEQVLRRWAVALGDRHDVVVVSHRPGGRRLRVDDLSARYETRTIDHPSQLSDVRADVISLHNRPGWVRWCGGDAAVTFHNYPVAWKSSRRTAPPAALSAVSASLARAAAERLGADVAVVPPSIDPTFARPPVRDPQPIVLSPNRLLRKKGVTALLEVAPRLPDVEFRFADLLSPWVRPTREHRELRAAVAGVANASLFPPETTAAGLAARYATAGVVACVAQEPEGLGLVPLEAQACGAPVVTTDLGGLPEATFPPNRTIAAGDADRLAEALGAALRQAEDIRPRKAVLDRYTPEASAAAFESWLLSAG